MLEVPHQGDATFNPGKSVNFSKRKNSNVPFETNDGATVTLTILKERPALTAHTRLATLAGTFEPVMVEYKDPNTGGEIQSGMAHISLGQETSGTDGHLEQEVTIAFVDDPTPGVSA
jgi:hypothetical protein